jgi:phage repressor protein C with HTH and peptisase S24 domain
MKICESRKYGHMNDPQHDLRLWLQSQLSRLGHGSKSQLAAYLGVRLDAITRMANTDPHKESREIRAHELDKMREFFATANDVLPFQGETEISVMGYLGAGAEVEPDYEQVPPEGIEQVTVPFPVPDDMIAFKVKGVSMLPVFKPDAVIVVYREQKKPLESFYGEEAAVRTSDGRRFIKTINRGSVPGAVNLISWNDPSPIENVYLDWIGEIFAVLPPAAIRKIARQGGLQGQLKLKTA